MLQPVTYVWPMTAGSIIGADAWYMALASSGALFTISGIPPIEFTSKGKPLASYSITGNTGGVGDLDGEVQKYKIPIFLNGKNLVSEIVRNETISATDGSFMPYQKSLRTGYIKAFAGSTYTISSRYYPYQNYISFYDADKKYLSRTSGMQVNSSRTFQVPSGASYFATNAFYAVSGQINPLDYDDFDLQVESGGTVTGYEQYSDPITHEIYIDSPLAYGDVLKSDGTITRADGTVESFDAPTLETITGTNALTIDTEVQPEDVTITGKGIAPIGGFELTTGDGEPILTGDGEPLTTKG